MAVPASPRRHPAIALIVLGLGLLGAVSACDQSAPSAEATVTMTPAAAPSAIPVRPVRTVTPSLLIWQDEPLSPATVRTVRTTKGVSQVALIGYRQVWIYDQQVPAAAVDPVTFRQFTFAATANSEQLWSAIDNGDALVSHEVGVRDRMPLDGTIPVGWGTVQLSGFATAIPGVDLLVGISTGRRLGVPFGNALVVAVSGDSATVPAELRRTLGPTTVIRQILVAPAVPSSTPEAILPTLAAGPPSPSATPPGGR